MAEHNELGKEGEKAAVDYLQKQGYTILRTNYVYQKAEIDVIALQGNVLAVVEVKTRSTLEYGLPQDFVKPKKIKLLVMAINRFIEEEGLDVDARFDIIAVHKKGSDFDIEHLKDAFFIF
ncbi:YraN family protein [Flavobacterium sp. RHBU_24]|uniref:YraN family protein n=1 Tax=Flavobacterium sp. RHBU_24 TaxID=3391185 RepID=UPI0039849A07